MAKNIPIYHITHINNLASILKDGRLWSDHRASIARLNRVKNLIMGFESPLGMELLSTVHWLVKHEAVSADNQEEIIRKIQSWNQHKKNKMKPAHIHIAIKRLKQEQWI